MEQMTLGFDPLPKKTRKAVFLEEMDRVVPLILPYAHSAHRALRGHRSRPPFPIEVMLRIHCVQRW